MHIKVLDQSWPSFKAKISDVISDETGNMRLLDALFRRKIPVGPDAPDAFYRHPRRKRVNVGLACILLNQNLPILS